jgi:21S rRNA (GM2251-2'-O)-methyltransferase
VADNRPHQGLVLDASPLDFEALEAFPEAGAVWGPGSEGPPPVWLCLDEVMDPVSHVSLLLPLI